MHITNQKLRFDIFTVGNLLNIFMEHDLNILMIFGHKRKMDNFDSYNVLLAIATNIPVLLMTAFVLQGHILVTIITGCHDNNVMQENFKYLAFTFISDHLQKDIKN